MVRIMNKGEKKKRKQADMPKESGSPHDKQKNLTSKDAEIADNSGKHSRAITGDHGMQPKYTQIIHHGMKEKRLEEIKKIHVRSRRQVSDYTLVFIPTKILMRNLRYRINLACTIYGNC